MVERGRGRERDGVCLGKQALQKHDREDSSALAANVDGCDCCTKTIIYLYSY